MSLGGNLSSGLTNSLIEERIRCEREMVAAINKGPTTPCSGIPIKQPTARYPSMIILNKTCAPPSPADFALYPKVAVPSSTRTQALASGITCSTLPNPLTRFAQYQRFQIPVPCPPLPDSANMAGKSLPSSRPCNL